MIGLHTVIVSIFSYLHLQIMYEVVEVVDEGLTQVGRAGRVNPKYEGKGFMKYFGIWIADWRKKNNIRTIAFTVVDANPAIKRHSFQQRNRHVLTKVYLPAFGPCQAKTCLQTSEKNEQIQIILHLHKVSSGPLLSIHTFCRTQQLYSWTVKSLIRLHGGAV